MHSAPCCTEHCVAHNVVLHECCDAQSIMMCRTPQTLVQGFVDSLAETLTLHNLLWASCASFSTCKACRQRFHLNSSIHDQAVVAAGAHLQLQLLHNGFNPSSNLHYTICHNVLSDRLIFQICH